jgi:hypothetical protein
MGVKEATKIVKTLEEITKKALSKSLELLYGNKKDRKRIFKKTNSWWTERLSKLRRSRNKVAEKN